MSPRSSASPSSSPLTPPRVNNAVPVRRLVRRVLCAERRIRVEGAPAAVPGAAKPDGADLVLEQLAAAHRPGAHLSLPAIAAAAGVGQATASAVRRWARAVGLWPYRAALSGFQARAAAREKGGER